MSCWVVPTVAADIWGVSLDHVLQCIKSGKIPTKKEDGFLFVDVAPDSRRVSRGTMEPEHPPTYTVVTRAELAALRDEEAEDSRGPAEDSHFQESGNDGAPTEADASSEPALRPDLSDWRLVRAAVGRRRIPPKFQMA